MSHAPQEMYYYNSTKDNNSMYRNYAGNNSTGAELFQNCIDPVCLKNQDQVLGYYL